MPDRCNGNKREGTFEQHSRTEWLLVVVVYGYANRQQGGDPDNAEPCIVQTVQSIG